MQNVFRVAIYPGNQTDGFIAYTELERFSLLTPLFISYLHFYGIRAAFHIDNRIRRKRSGIGIYQTTVYIDLIFYNTAADHGRRYIYGYVCTLNKVRTVLGRYGQVYRSIISRRFLITAYLYDNSFNRLCPAGFRGFGPYRVGSFLGIGYSVWGKSGRVGIHQIVVYKNLIFYDIATAGRGGQVYGYGFSHIINDIIGRRYKIKRGGLGLRSRLLFLLFAVIVGFVAHTYGNRFKRFYASVICGFDAYIIGSLLNIFNGMGRKIATIGIYQIIVHENLVLCDASLFSCGYIDVNTITDNESLVLFWGYD